MLDASPTSGPRRPDTILAGKFAGTRLSDLSFAELSEQARACFRRDPTMSLAIQDELRRRQRAHRGRGAQEG